jgi:hypothetical protein
MFRKRSEWSDEELIHAIQAGGIPASRALAYLYGRSSGWKEALWAVIKRSIPQEWFEEIFTDTMIAFERHVRNDTFRKESKLQTFFLGIAKNKFVKRMKKEGKEPPMEDISEPEVEAKLEKPSLKGGEFGEEEKDQIWAIVEGFGKRCLILLKGKYLDVPGPEIMAQTNIKSPIQLAKETNRCRDRMKKKFQANPALWNLFNE